jgi:hypothetical protein
MKKRYELYDGINPDPIFVEERDATPAEMNFARRDALAAKWPDAFALLDDILVRGIDTVKAERNQIKQANPKGD